VAARLRRRGGVVAWWRGGVVAWWRGGEVARWRGGEAARWRGAALPPCRPLSFTLTLSAQSYFWPLLRKVFT